MTQMTRRIRAARAYAHLSQPELAEKLEIHENTMKRIESGKRTPKRSELLAIAEACEVPMWFLQAGWKGAYLSKGDAPLTKPLPTAPAEGGRDELEAQAEGEADLSDAREAPDEPDEESATGS